LRVFFAGGRVLRGKLHPLSKMQPLARSRPGKTVKGPVKRSKARSNGQRPGKTVKGPVKPRSRPVKPGQTLAKPRSNPPLTTMSAR
jgi:hypothetical protein